MSTFLTACHVLCFFQLTGSAAPASRLHLLSSYSFRLSETLRKTTLCSHIYLCVYYNYHNKQRLFRFMALFGMFSEVLTEVIQNSYEYLSSDD